MSDEKNHLSKAGEKKSETEKEAEKRFSLDIDFGNDSGKRRVRFQDLPLGLKLKYLLLTFFFVGRLPFAQGTFASFFSLPFFWLIRSFAENLGLLYFADFALLLSLLTLSIYLTLSVRKLWSERDPSEIVFDEVLGMFLSIFLLPSNLTYYIVAFFLFRFFDIVKFPPANFFDRMQNPIGIMLDDVVAGIYSNLLTRIIISVLIGKILQ